MRRALLRVPGRAEFREPISGEVHRAPAAGSRSSSPAVWIVADLERDQPDRRAGRPRGRHGRDHRGHARLHLLAGGRAPRDGPRELCWWARLRRLPALQLRAGPHLPRRYRRSLPRLSHSRSISIEGYEAGYRKASLMAFLVPLLSLAVPLLDTLASIVRRLRAGQPRLRGRPAAHAPPPARGRGLGSRRRACRSIRSRPAFA